MQPFVSTAQPKEACKLEFKEILAQFYTKKNSSCYQKVHLWFSFSSTTLSNEWTREQRNSTLLHVFPVILRQQLIEFTFIFILKAQNLFFKNIRTESPRIYFVQNFFQERPPQLQIKTANLSTSLKVR